MLPYLTTVQGNPSSVHAFGRVAREALDEAHAVVAGAIGAEAREIVFTSGGTEANNLALKGAAWAAKARGHRIIASRVEHHSVSHTLRYLEKFGFEIAEVRVDRYGRVDPDEIEAEITDKTILVSVMLANNEVGTIQPIAAIAERVRAHRGVLLHVDAVQAAPWLPIDVDALGVDLLTLAAHKLEGPKGVGALYLRRGTTLLAQQQGGTQERYRRAGTEDVAGAVGMAEALRLSVAERAETTSRVLALRETLRSTLTGLPGVELSGHPVERLPGILSVIIPGIDSSGLVMALDGAGVAVSNGSACTNGSNDPSEVLLAMGYPPAEARGPLRLSLGRTTTDKEVGEASAILARVIERVQAGAAALAARALAEAALAPYLLPPEVPRFEVPSLDVTAPDPGGPGEPTV